GNFDLNVASLGLSPGDFVTVAANYSADPPASHRGRTQTSNFANPVTVLAPIVITSIARTGTTLTITWTGGAPPYTLQKKNSLTGSWNNVATGILGNSTTDMIAGTQGYYRIADP